MDEKGIGMNEHTTLLGPTKSLVGVVTEPSEDTCLDNNLAVMLLNSGLIHRVGPNRLYVKIARMLAELGVNSIRYDFSNVGDSQARRDNLPAQDLAFIEPQEVMNDLAERKGFEKFILIGICSGAFCSFKTACKDPRVIGVVIINPGYFSSDTDMPTYVLIKHYLTKSLFSPKAWLNLFSGRVAYKRLFNVILSQFTMGSARSNKEGAAVVDSIKSGIESLIDRNVQILFIFSEEDRSVDYLSVVLGRNMREMKSEGPIQSELIPGADHLFTKLSDQQRVLKILESWMLKLIKRDR